MESIDYGAVIGALTGIVLAATTIVKMGVDALRLFVDMPKWGPLVAAFVLSLVVVWALAKASGLTFNGAILAQWILASLMTTGLAVGVTEIARRADGRNPGVTNITNIVNKDSSGG